LKKKKYFKNNKFSEKIEKNKKIKKISKIFRRSNFLSVKWVVGEIFVGEMYP
jgi:hypothetical protein